MYSYEEALKTSMEYFQGSELSAKVFVDKYALRDKENNLLESNPDQMHRRLAKEFARIEAAKFKKPYTEDFIYNLFKNYSVIIPQGSPIMGIGNPYSYVTLSNCYVLTTPEDSYNSILMTDRELVNISKRRGGVGINLSKLRPEGTPTQNAARTSTGIVSWMERYSNSIREVGQCIEQNQRVLTSNGLKKIKDIKLEEMVWTKNGWTKVVNILNNGKKKVYKVTTDCGYSVITSKDHVFQTFNKNGQLTEHRLSELEAGDNLVLSIANASHDSNYIKLNKDDYKNSNNKPSNCILPEILNEDLAYLLGYSYGDGYISNDKYGEKGLELACSNDYSYIKTKLKNIIINIFDYNPIFHKADGDLETLDINNKTIVQFLKYNNLLKEKSSEIKFPDKILDSTISVQLAFIAGYFDADGDCAGKKAGYRFRSINLKFLENIQILLSTYGILSKISFEDRSKNNWKILYTLSVIGKSSTEKFLNKFTNYSIKVKLKPFISKRDCWLTPFKAKSFNIKYNNYKSCPDNSQYISLAVLEKLKIDYPNIIDSLVQDKIKTIKYIGEEETFDLVLESEHLFWCEGIYLHNSGRRGALMLTLSVHHPDIETFITIKNDKTKVTGANISVMLTDEFLNAVKKNEEFELRFPVDSSTPTISKKVNAKKIWDLIIKNAHSMAEPGLLFWDNIIKESPADCYKEQGFETKATNPCSEIPLSELDSCRLMAINLFSCVINPFEKNAKYDYKLLYLYSQIAQRLMDDLIDLELECIDKILKKIKNDPESETIKREEYDLWYNIRQNCVIGRRTGLGPTVLGDTLAALGIKYGSNESIETVEEIYKTLKFGAYQSSVDIAKELGPFMCWDRELEKDNLFLNRFKEESGEELYKEMKKYGRRNISLLTTAPTGTISTQASMKVRDKLYFNTTAGIEPLFKTHYTRRKKGNPGDKNFKSDFVDQKGDHWQEFEVYHSGVQAWMDVTEKDKIDKTCPYFNCTAEEINWVQRVKLQAAAQKHIDHAISSTINLPEDVTEEEVAKIYETAWKSGLKGITVYRANCRTGVLIEKKETKRPKELSCAVHHVTVKNQQYLVLVGMMNGKPYETFACKNGILDKNIKTGKIIKIKNNFYKAVFDDETELSPITASCSEHEETISRLTSLALRTGTDYVHIIDQLNKVQGDMTSYAKCIARVLKKYVKDGTTSLEDCPECKTKLVFNSGCTNCVNCGYSKCS